MLVTNGPFTALEKIAGSFYVRTMKSDKIHLEPRPAFCKGDKLLKQPAEERGWLFRLRTLQKSSWEVYLNKHGALGCARRRGGCLGPGDLMISSDLIIPKTVVFKIPKEMLSLV